jgi:hypothetical protein
MLMPKFEFSIEQTVRRRRIAVIEAANETEAREMVERGMGEIREWAFVPEDIVDATNIEFLIVDESA